MVMESSEIIHNTWVGRPGKLMGRYYPDIKWWAKYQIS